MQSREIEIRLQSHGFPERAQCGALVADGGMQATQVMERHRVCGFDSPRMLEHRDRPVGPAAAHGGQRNDGQRLDVVG
jgi:hypothetical protein